jgi:hypothetical protein
MWKALLIWKKSTPTFDWKDQTIRRNRNDETRSNGRDLNAGPFAHKAGVMPIYPQMCQTSRRTARMMKQFVRPDVHQRLLQRDATR